MVTVQFRGTKGKCLQKDAESMFAPKRAEMDISSGRNPSFQFGKSIFTNLKVYFKLPVGKFVVH